ncbi:MAG TPA: tetratricopeptide repeat protein [Methylomirabilota bacterium]|nr:tetratricopeptide repeat protein [Methylomirabilota bacterium]
MTLALAMLVLSLPITLFVAWPLLGRRPAPPADPADSPRAALEAEKLLALHAIRELAWDREAGLLAEDDYAELRLRYEARASALLKQLDALPPPRPIAPALPSAPPTPGLPWTRRPAVLTAGGLALLLFGIALGILAMRFAAPAPPEPTAAVDPSVAAPTKPLPPAMLQGMLQAARASFDAGRYDEAAAAYQAVLKRQPENVDALTHVGALLAMAGHVDAALSHFDRALGLRPDDPEALWFKAGILYQLRHDYAGAIAAWERFVAVAPDAASRQQALGLIGEARARRAESGAASR